MMDVLTGLSNRLAIRESLRHALFRAEREKTKLALLMIDLDRFKPINDRYGHLIGDLVLKEVAARMAKVVRNSELRGRYGGDEFVALVEFGDDDEVPRRVGRRLVEGLSAPMTFDGLTLDIGASVGFAVYPSDATDEEQLMRKADTALYAVKEAGRGNVLAYSSDMEATVEARAELEQDLRQAIRSGLIAPFYQPLVELATGNICGLEVLSRWHHPVKGIIMPVDFVELAESAGMINDMTMAVLQKACLESRTLPPHLTIAINIAPRQIQDEWLAQKIMTVLAKTKFPPQRLEVELTENALVDDIASAKHVISTLKAQGIKVALDDFGTGYSSLWYLSELPFDKIKIDRSFIKTLHERPESAKIVSAIIGLGKSLGVPTIAEGVESERDAEVLRSLGCTIAQGFFYSKPVPAADLSEVVKSLSATRSKRVA
jgi:diguanylate cyclase (GGDEF)-like protein